MLSLSSNSLPSASCCESYAILDEVSGRTLSVILGRGGGLVATKRHAKQKQHSAHSYPPKDGRHFTWAETLRRGVGHDIRQVSKMDN